MFPSRRHQPPPTPDENQKYAPHQNYYSLRRRSHCPMGNDGGTGSGLPSPDNPTTTTAVPTKLLNKYYPKIYSYKCYGKYSTTSNMNDTYNKNGAGVGGGGVGGGKCYGIAKAMETLYNEPVRMSRIEALQRFTSMNSDVDLDDYNQHHSHHDDDDHNNRDDNSDGSELSEQAVYLSPALIYKNEGIEKKMSVNAKEFSGVKDSSGMKDSSEVNDSTKKEHIPNVHYYDDRLLEEEVILEQDWTCYGATDVEYLSLEDARTGESTLVAVAPRNTGLSIRNIQTDDHLRSLTRCSLGWIDILHDSNSVLEYEDDDDENEAKKTTNEKRSVKESLADMMKKKNTDGGNIDEQIRQTPSILTELRLPKDVESIVKIGQEHMKYTFEFSKLVSTHVQNNVQWLYNNFKDDFPNRTVEAGKRLIIQIPKTIDGTVTTMNKIVQQLIRGRGDDDDDDDDNFSLFL